MIRSTLPLLLLLLALPIQGLAQRTQDGEPAGPRVLASSDPGAFLSEVLGVMERNWLYSEQVDWDELCDLARANLGEAESHGDTFEAIYTALRMGGDRHSFLLPAEHYARWRGEGSVPEGMTTVGPTAGAIEALAPGFEADWRSVAPFEGLEFRLLQNRVGYVKLPPLGSADELLCLAYATQVYEGIRTLEENHPRGWVVDLRDITGGNCWPMLAGLSNLIGEGQAGSFVGPDGVEHFGVGRGSAWVSSPAGVRLIEQCVATRPFSLTERTPLVAVLTGPYTASSGEVLATAFRGRRDSRSFGARTAGYSTGSRGFELSDGSCLFLATSIYADRCGVRYPHGILCDERVIATDPEGRDADLDAALRWLTRA